MAGAAAGRWADQALNATGTLENRLQPETVLLDVVISDEERKVTWPLWPQS